MLFVAYSSSFFFELPECHCGWHYGLLATPRRSSTARLSEVIAQLIHDRHHLRRRRKCPPLASRYDHPDTVSLQHETPPMRCATCFARVVPREPRHRRLKSSPRGSSNSTPERTGRSPRLFLRRKPFFACSFCLDLAKIGWTRSPMRTPAQHFLLASGYPRCSGKDDSRACRPRQSLRRRSDTCICRQRERTQHPAARHRGCLHRRHSGDELRFSVQAAVMTRRVGGRARESAKQVSQAGVTTEFL
jgi:hypothetical protein